jgi:Tfp pilus assembly protein PilN
MKTRLNLLPREFQDAMASARRVKRWLLVFWLLGVLGFGILYQERREVHQLKAEREQHLTEVQSLRSRQSESHAARKKIEELQTRHTLVSMLENEVPVVQIVGVFSRSAQDPKRRIQVAELRAEEVLRNIAAGHSAPNPANNRKPQSQAQEKVLAVVVTGVAQDDMIVAQFVERLRESKMFQSVKLASTTGDHQQSPSERHFQIECVY